MNRYGPRRKGLPASQVLTYNDLAFINEYLANGQNGTQAYLKVHAKASARTAGVEAVRVLEKPSVKDHIRRRLIIAGLTPQELQSRLEWCRDKAQKDGDAALLASICMDQAKLAGFLVDKHEVKTLEDNERDPIRHLVASSLSQVQSG